MNSLSCFQMLAPLASRAHARPPVIGHRHVTGIDREPAALDISPCPGEIARTQVEARNPALIGDSADQATGKHRRAGDVGDAIELGCPFGQATATSQAIAPLLVVTATSLPPGNRRRRNCCRSAVPQSCAATAAASAAGRSTSLAVAGIKAEQAVVTATNDHERPFDAGPRASSLVTLVRQSSFPSFCVERNDVAPSANRRRRAGRPCHLQTAACRLRRAT